MSAEDTSVNCPASPLTDAHWTLLFSILDAVIPSVVVRDSPNPDQKLQILSKNDFDHLYHKLQQDIKNPPSPEVLRDFLAARPSENEMFVGAVKRSIGRLSPSVVGQLLFILGFMSTRLGSLISTGYLTTISEQSIMTREAVLQSWGKSWFFLWPMLARTFVALAKIAWTQAEPKLQQITKYCSSRDNPQVKPGPPFDFDFLQFDASADLKLIETDVVIVGSGPGGAVCAKTLAEAGHRVLVVDRGYYFPPDELPVNMLDLGMVMQGGGGLSTADGSTLVIAGSGWGGGGSVNWSVSLQTSDGVKREWAKSGLPFFETQEYQESLDRVCSVMGVSDGPHLRHNYGNQMLIDGAKKLGWQMKVCPQNTGGSQHFCGCSCGLGCREGKKQGPVVAWLPAAAKAGAKFIEGLEVTKLVFDDEEGQKKVTGIEGVWRSRDESGSASSGKPRVSRPVNIKAKRVIVAGGALNTPLLLLKSGLKNPNIGKHLHLHPAGCFTAAFEDEVKGWEGEIATAVVTEFDNIDNQGFGSKVMGAAMWPLVCMLQIPWHNGLQFKLDALKYPHLACFISVARDRDEGQVTPEPTDGSPVISYTPSKFDRGNIVVGLAAAAKLAYLQGARELMPILPNFPTFKCENTTNNRSLEDPGFAKWIQQLEETDMNPTNSNFSSAHQMSTCRMSTSARDGVVDDQGKVWDTENLYIADASVLPSASGVNPMITIMATSDHIGRAVAESL